MSKKNIKNIKLKVLLEIQNSQKNLRIILGLFILFLMLVYLCSALYSLQLNILKWSEDLLCATSLILFFSGVLIIVIIGLLWIDINCQKLQLNTDLKKLSKRYGYE